MASILHFRINLEDKQGNFLVTLEVLVAGLSPHGGPDGQNKLAIETGGKKPKPAKAGAKVSGASRQIRKARLAQDPRRARQGGGGRAAAEPVTPAELTKRFARAKPAEVAEVAEILETLDRARPGDEKGAYVI